MGEFSFERDCRTPYSESFVIVGENDRMLARVELHYMSSVVHGTLCITDEVGPEGTRELVRAIDEEIVATAGVPRQELIIHVFQGREIGVIGDSGFDQNGNGLERI